MGDTSDNVKGVPGIGEKGARDLITPVRLARIAARRRGHGHPEALPGGAAGARRRRPPEPGARHDPHRLSGDVRRRGVPLHRRDPRRRVQAVHRSRLPVAGLAVRPDRRGGRTRLRGRRAGRDRGAGGRVPRRRIVRLARRHRRHLADAGDAGRPQHLDQGMPGPLRAAGPHARHRRRRDERARRAGRPLRRAGGRRPGGAGARRHAAGAAGAARRSHR